MKVDDEDDMKMRKMNKWGKN